MNSRAFAPTLLTASEQAQLWRQLFQHTPGGILGLEVVRDPQSQVIIDFRYRFINEVALRDVFRRHPEQQHDITGQLFSTYFPSIRELPLWTLYLSVVESQKAVEGAGAYLLDGHSLRVQMAISPYSSDGILISYTEVSENHRTLQELERQSAKLTAMLESSPNAVVVFDAVRDRDGQIIDFRVNRVNQPFVIMVGRPATYFVGFLLRKMYPVSPNQMKALIRLMYTGEPLRHEEYLTTHDRWFDIVLNRIEDGFVATLYDITARKKSLDQLERQAQLLAGLMNTVQNGLTVMEAIRDEAGRLVDFRYVEASQSMLRGIGKTRPEVIGNRLLSLLPSLNTTTLWPIYLRVLETGVPHQFENRYNADGFDLYFDLSVAKLNDGLVVSYTNITEAKQAQIQLEKLVIELRRSNESLDQFAYVASHDLQEPLRKIVSLGDVLQQQITGELDSSTADLIKRMQNAAGRMRILVQDLLTYSRLTGHPALYESIALDHILASVLADYHNLIDERQASISIKPLPAVWGDSRLLLQLFQNLISNGIKFCQPGHAPRIAITGQIVSNPEALPTVSRCAEISIRDEGIGFDEKYLDRIFTVFQRLHTQQQYAGTGIGLAICKKVVELHNGAITARSQPGSGTTFLVWLPLA